MKPISRISFVFALLVLVTQNGCLLNHSQHTILRHDEPLRPVTFESESARSTFEKCVSSECKDDCRKASASFAIPFLVGLERSQTISETAIRNDVGAKFDINGDGHISDYEASLQMTVTK